MTEVHGRVPCHGCMAGLAVIGRKNVIGRFGRSPHRGAHAVTLLAITRGAFKYCIDVARFAREVAVLAGEFETCRQVIEESALHGHVLGRMHA